MSAVALDLGIGLGFEQLQKRVYGDSGVGSINLCLSKRPDILLLGSSRMKHHAVPRVLSDKLQLSVYNAGQDGYDLLYSAVLLDLWGARNPAPRAVVVHVDADSFTRNPIEIDRISVFGLFARESAFVRRVIAERGRFDTLKRVSRSYRANGKALNILKGVVVPSKPENSAEGFAGLRGRASHFLGREEADERWASGSEIWDFKLDCIRGMNDYCRRHGTRLILVHSPYYYEGPLERDALGRALVEVKKRFADIEVFDISGISMPEIFHRKAHIYYDDAHLNLEGAEKYTALLAAELGRLQLAQ